MRRTVPPFGGDTDEHRQAAVEGMVMTRRRCCPSSPGGLLTRPSPVAGIGTSGRRRPGDCGDPSGARDPIRPRGHVRNGGLRMACDGQGSPMPGDVETLQLRRRQGSRVTDCCLFGFAGRSPIPARAAQADPPSAKHQGFPPYAALAVRFSLRCRLKRTSAAPITPMIGTGTASFFSRAISMRAAYSPTRRCTQWGTSGRIGDEWSPHGPAGGGRVMPGDPLRPVRGCGVLRASTGARGEPCGRAPARPSDPLPRR